MSIVTFYALRLLYNRANADGALENHTMAFWMHWLTKHIFVEENWVATQEQPPSSAKRDELRRMDAKFESVINTGLKIFALAEAKKRKGSMTTVEAQLLEGCQAAYMHDGVAPYGLALIGTAIKFFQYQPNGMWVELTNGYMDADSPQYGPEIRRMAIFIEDSVRPQPIPSHNQIAAPIKTQGSATQTYGSGQTVGYAAPYSMAQVPGT